MCRPVRLPASLLGSRARDDYSKRLFKEMFVEPADTYRPSLCLVVPGPSCMRRPGPVEVQPRAALEAATYTSTCSMLYNRKHGNRNRFLLCFLLFDGACANFTAPYISVTNKIFIINGVYSPDKKKI